MSSERQITTRNKLLVLAERWNLCGRGCTWTWAYMIIIADVSITTINIRKEQFHRDKSGFSGLSSDKRGSGLDSMEIELNQSLALI